MRAEEGAINALAKLTSIENMSDPEKEWLRGVAGWTTEECGFYEAFFVVPEGGDVYWWWATRPVDYDSFLELTKEAEVDGGTREAKQVGIAGFGPAHKANSRIRESGRAEAVLREVMLDRLKKEFSVIVASLRCCDYTGARGALRASSVRRGAKSNPPPR